MPNSAKPSILELAEALAASMPSLQADERQLAIALYRRDRLADGEPVPTAALADDLGRDESQVHDTVDRWPGVFRDDEGRVVSFWGLAIPEMPHRFRVDGCGLYTWCAWDALFIPELIGRTAEVESRSPLGGETVRLIVALDGVRELAPETTVVSMLSPAAVFDDRVIMSFCHFVQFFPSSDTAAGWIAEHPGAFLLSVAEAHELGRIVNGKRFGADLTSPSEAVRV